MGRSALEWATTSSPPPSYNFLDPPTVNWREAALGRSADQPVVVGLREDIREVLSTQAVDAIRTTATLLRAEHLAFPCVIGHYVSVYRHHLHSLGGAVWSCRW